MLKGQTLIEDINNWSGEDNSLAFWWLAQAGVVMKMMGKVVYIDLYLSPNEKRQVPPLLAPEQVTNADFVLCTHDHSDHIDPGSIQGIAAASPQGIIVVPHAARKRVVDLGVPPERVVSLNAGETYEGKGLKITGVKAKHEFFDRTPEGFYPYMGYVIESGNLCVYHGGDTLVYDGMLATLKRFDITVAFLPINGRDAPRYLRGCLGNMTYQEAVDLAGELRPQLVVPIHYDMFAFNSEDPQKFIEYLQAKYPGINTWVGAPGQRVEVKSP